jgi:hypothetical protein
MNIYDANNQVMGPFTVGVKKRKRYSKKISKVTFYKHVHETNLRNFE